MQHNILLVDDEAGIIHAIRRMLRAEPLSIHEASNGDEALAILARHDIHLMVTDYKMPGMDGLSLCRETRRVSPTTYRLLLSGQVDYSELRRAWADGDVHRFVAKPWDNLLLTMDIKEGLKQHALLDRMHQLGQQLQTQQPTLLTDSNWIVRLANAPMCRALQCNEEDLLGVNLFAQALSAMPVTLETEVTRQVEEGKTWLGHFNLTGPSQQKHQAWMAIAPLGEQYRLCSCNWVSEDLNPDRDINDELKRYSGEHHLQRLQQAADLASRQPQLMVVSLPGDPISMDLSAMCYERLQAATDDLYEIYSPQPNTFLILLPAAVPHTQTESLQENILQDFNQAMNYQGQNLMLAPEISIEEKPADITDWSEWLRMRLGLQSMVKPAESEPDTPDNPQSGRKSHSQHNALPVFNQLGELVALQVPAEHLAGSSDWPAWIADMTVIWRQHFNNRELQFIITAAEHPDEGIRQFATALNTANPGAAEAGNGLTVILGEDCVLSQAEEDLSWRDELRTLGCRIFIANFGRSFVNSRQLLGLPIQGVSLAPEFLTHMRNSKSLPQSRRLLQRMHDHKLVIYAPNMDNTESLASAHQSNVNWLSGNLLSAVVSSDQLAWFSSDGEIG
tara:strand:+ start:102222 stop:104078 length:1857 start_codon:yes stop_codon:yes gene_type:complete